MAYDIVGRAVYNSNFCKTTNAPTVLIILWVCCRCYSAPKILWDHLGVKRLHDITWCICQDQRAVSLHLASLVMFLVNRNQGVDSIQRYHLTGIGNPIEEIRRSYDRLISTMIFPTLVRWHLYIESGPWIRRLRCTQNVTDFTKHSLFFHLRYTDKVKATDPVSMYIWSCDKTKY